MTTYPPGLSLACSLRPLRSCWREGGIMQQIALAFEFGQYDRLFGDKREVVRLAVASNFWRDESEGRGNKAARRIGALEYLREKQQDDAWTEMQGD